MTKPNSSTAAAARARQIGHSDAPAGHDTSTREMTIAGHGAGINRSEIPFSEALKVWLELGLLSFGGPAGQIALMHRLVVEERRWIGEAHFLHALNYCMLLPGPEAQQLATYVGWLLHRTWGGLAAGLLFILPGAAVMAALSVAYAVYGDLFIVNALFYGIKTAVLAIVVEAAMRIGKRALKNRAMYLIALAAFVAIFLFAVPFPLIIAAAAVAGIFAANSWDPQANAEPAMEPVQTQPSARHTVLVVAVCLLLWLTPVVALVLWDGAGVYAREGLFFSKMAVVTFGGAYAVLAYVAQQAVDTFGWLLPGEMLDGLGLAETTPGPLILVVQFVGFPGGIPRARRARCHKRRHARGGADAVGHVRALLHVDPGRRTLYRTVARQPAPEPRPGRNHRSGGRRRAQPGALVRATRGFRQAVGTPNFATAVHLAGLDDGGLVCAGANH